MMKPSREHDRTVRLKAKDQAPHSLASHPKAIARKHFASIVRPQRPDPKPGGSNDVLATCCTMVTCEDLSELLRSERHRHNDESQVVVKIPPLPWETVSVTGDT